MAAALVINLNGQIVHGISKFSGAFGVETLTGVFLSKLAGVWITTPYATEVQSMTGGAKAALGEAQSGATLYCTDGR